MCVKDDCKGKVSCYACGRNLCQLGDDFCELLEYNKALGFYFCRTCTEELQGNYQRAVERQLQASI